MLALKVSAFVEVAEFKTRVDEAIRQLHDCRLAPGFERIYVPGEQEWRTRELYRREGIPLDGPTRAAVAHPERQAGSATVALAWLGEA